jgi:hypothetical protein
MRRVFPYACGRGILRIRSGCRAMRSHHGRRSAVGAPAYRHVRHGCRHPAVALLGVWASVDAPSLQTRTERVLTVRQSSRQRTRGSPAGLDRPVEAGVPPVAKGGQSVLRRRPRGEQRDSGRVNFAPRAPGQHACHHYHGRRACGRVGVTGGAGAAASAAGGSGVLTGPETGVCRPRLWHTVWAPTRRARLASARRSAAPHGSAGLDTHRQAGYSRASRRRAPEQTPWGVVTCTHAQC